VERFNRNRIRNTEWMTNYYLQKAKEVGMKVTVYDGRRDMDGLAAEVEAHLGLA
jgi:hypothetical protein